jgi:uncharacterized protein (TIGR03067 family)
MKRIRILSLAVLVLLAADSPPDAVKKDLDRLQGTWLLVSGKRDGQTIPEEVVKKATLVVEGNRYKISDDVGTAAEGTFAIDPGKSPKWLDATPSAGPTKGKTWLGIYTVEGNIHKACIAPPGKERPREFASPEGSGIINEVWKKKE